MSDDVLAALALPFTRELLSPPQRALFLRAEPVSGFAAWRERLVCEQTFKPAADALQRAGYRCVGEGEAIEGAFDLAMVRLTRDRREASNLVGRAYQHLAPGGILLAAGAKNEGAQSIERDLAAAHPLDEVLPKHGCRVFWLTKPAANPALEQLTAGWREAARPCVAIEDRFTTQPGIFSAERIDPGSKLLADTLPGNLNGLVADLGCGWGYLAFRLLAGEPGVKRLDVYEAERLALDCARINLAGAAHAAALGFHWRDIGAGLPHRRHYDAIVMNPPFHAGRAADPDLGRRFIRIAADALKPHGALWMVANRHLPYESTLTDAFGAFEQRADSGGFKVLAARLGTAPPRKRP